MNTNYVLEEIASVLDDIVTKIENKDVKKQSDIRKFTPKRSQMRALKQNSVNENAVKTGEQESETTVTEQEDETVVQETVVPTPAPDVMVSGPTFYPLKKCIYEHYYPGCKAIARDTPGNTSNPGSKEFAVFPNWLAVETYVRSLPLPQRNLYEICLYSSELSI